MIAKNLHKWAKENITANRVRVGIIIIFFALAAWGILLAHYSLVIGHSWWALLLTTACIGVSPELAGIVFGVVIIDYLNEWRQEQQLKKQLIMQLGSENPSVADTALRTLKSYGWGFKKDKTLQGAELFDANLQKADLCLINLEGAWLDGANLEGLILDETNLKGASLDDANLKRAVISIKQLESTKSFRGATMPDGTKPKEWISRLYNEGKIDDETRSRLFTRAFWKGEDE